MLNQNGMLTLIRELKAAMGRGVPISWGQWYLLVGLHYAYLRANGIYADDVARGFQAHKIAEAEMGDLMDSLTGDPDNLPDAPATITDFMAQYDITV